MIKCENCSTLIFEDMWRENQGLCRACTDEVIAEYEEECEGNLPPLSRSEFCRG